MYEPDKNEESGAESIPDALADLVIDLLEGPAACRRTDLEELLRHFPEYAERVRAWLHQSEADPDAET